MGAKSRQPTINRKTTTLYRSSHCAALVEMGKEGKSIAEFCASIGVSEEAFYDWKCKYPEFKEAHKIFTAYSKAWWQAKGKKHLVTNKLPGGGGEHFDTNLYKFIVGGRFGLSSDADLDFEELGQGSLSKQHKAALKALGQGKLSRAQAATISQLLKDAIDIAAHEDITNKLTEIERKLESMGSVKVDTKYAQEPEYEIVKE